jgi:hypothetical protein
MIDQQGIWIMDNSSSEKIHQWMLWIMLGKEGKTSWQSPVNMGQVDLGF